jgi:hypothetical protein
MTLGPMLFVFVALTCCAAPPPPPPPPPPPVQAEPAPEPKPALPPRPTPASLSVLHRGYDEANERLRAYRELPRCAPSGPIACNDPKLERWAADAGKQARQSMTEVAQLRIALHIATARVAAFQAVVKELPADED